MSAPVRPTPRATDKALDDALAGTFPASDPVAMEQPVHSPSRPPPSTEAPVVETKTEARQGITGHKVRYVLTFGLAGAVAALVLVYLYYYG